jgi:hypothetical protein
MFPLSFIPATDPSSGAGTISQIMTYVPRGLSLTPTYVGFEVLTAVVMNLALFWDIALGGLYLKRRFGGK